MSTQGPARIAVIGAGIAGLTAARDLARAGHDVVVVDKGRGLGGRMATRRVDGLAFDHGAQYFTVRGEAFRREQAAWVDAGAAARWFDESYVGTPGMTAPARALAAGLHVVPSCEVKRLARSDRGWRLDDANGPVDVSGNGTFHTLVLAVPAPQAMTLLASAAPLAGFDLTPVARARYAPCWAVMLAFSERLDIADRVEPEHGPIGWIARNGSKPGRTGDAGDSIVVHARPAWSREHLELDPAAAGAAILDAFAVATGVTARPTLTMAHRWRYALVEEAAGIPFLWTTDHALGLCGDWCIAARVEAAFDSGRRLAEAIIAEGARA